MRFLINHRKNNNQWKKQHRTNNTSEHNSIRIEKKWNNCVGTSLQEAQNSFTPLVRLYLFYILLNQQHIEFPQVHRIQWSPCKYLHTISWCRCSSQNPVKNIKAVIISALTSPICIWTLFSKNPTLFLSPWTLRVYMILSVRSQIEYESPFLDKHHNS